MYEIDTPSLLGGIWLGAFVMALMVQEGKDKAEEERDAANTHAARLEVEIERVRTVQHAAASIEEAHSDRGERAISSEVEISPNRAVTNDTSQF